MDNTVLKIPEKVGECWKVFEHMGLAKPELPLESTLFHNATKLAEFNNEIVSLQQQVEDMKRALERARNTMEDALSAGEERYIGDFDEKLRPWCDLTMSVDEINVTLKSLSTTEPTYTIGEPVGITWEPQNREFEVCDIREIRFQKSGDSIIEYQLCRIGNSDPRTDWVPEDKLFKIINAPKGEET